MHTGRLIWSLTLSYTGCLIYYDPTPTELRDDENPEMTRDTKRRDADKAHLASDERASRWLAENFELCKSTDRNACFVCAKQHLPVRNPANTAKSAKPSRLQLDATTVSSAGPPRRKVLNEPASPPPPLLHAALTIYEAGPGPKAQTSPPRVGAYEFRSCARPTGAEFLRSQAIADRSKHHERAERSTHHERAQMLEQAKLLELVQAAMRSGHVVLVGAVDTSEKRCCSPGKQVELLVDAPYEYFSSLTVAAAVAQQKAALVACAGCMTISEAYLCMFCLTVVEIVMVMCGYACLAAYLRY